MSEKTEISNLNLLKTDQKDLKSNKLIDQTETSKPDPALVKAQLYSSKFLLLFLITVIKGSINFYYSNETKLIGMRMVHDDLFITYSTVIGIVINFLFRLTSGKLEDWVGFGGMYFLNIFLNICTSFTPFLIPNPKIALCVFITFQRTSNGKKFLVNFFLFN